MMAVRKISEMNQIEAEAKLAQMEAIANWSNNGATSSVTEQIAQLRRRLQELDRNGQYQRITD
jgi:hypothetical protein